MQGVKNAKLRGHASPSGTTRWVVIMVMKFSLNFGIISYLTGCQSVRRIALCSGLLGVTSCSLAYKSITSISEESGISTSILMIMMMMAVVVVVVVVVVVMMMMIPADRNVVQKEAEKNLKYRSLCIEIQRMWNLKCTIIPITIGATGIVTRSLRKKFGSCTRKTFDRFITKDSYIWNITHNTESTAE